MLSRQGYRPCRDSIVPITRSPSRSCTSSGWAMTSATGMAGCAEVIAQPEDVHDLDGLRVIGTVLSRQGR